MTLRELRKARKLTQVRMAKQLGITQDSVSRPLSAGHAYASLADARSSFGDNGGGHDGAPQH